MLLPPRLQYVDSVFVLYEHGYLDSMLDEVGECRVRGSVYEAWRREGERGGGGALKLKVYITFPKVLDLVSRTRVRGLTAACNSSWLKRHFHICPNPHIHK